MVDYLQLLRNNDKVELKLYLNSHSVNEEIDGQSLLYLAAYLNNIEFSQILLNRGANANFKDKANRSVLSICCYFGFYDIAKLLLENEAAIDASCMERAYFGWDGNIQLEILSLLREMGWINLYLDDLRDCPEGFLLAKTVDEAISIIENNNVHFLSIDHDLGEDNEGNLLATGYDLVKYVCEKGLRPANKIFLHTDNVVGRENMYQTLLAAQKRGFIAQDIEIYQYPFIENKYSEG